MSYYILKPKSLDLEQLILEFPPRFKLDIQFAYYIVHLIIIRKAWQKETCSSCHYTPLCSNTLQSIHRRYNDHIRYLLSIILSRMNYEEGKCYSYRLINEYENDFLDYYHITDRKLTKKIIRQNLIPSNIKKRYNFLVGYFNKANLTIDLTNAFAENHLLLKSTDYTYKKYCRNAINILRIQNGNYFFSYNPLTDGRLHTVITHFPRVLRNHLRYNSQSLLEVDISASVPTILYLFLKHFMAEEHKTTPIYNIIYNIISDKSYYTHLMSVKESLSLDITELARFSDKVSEGTLYRDFQTQLEDTYKKEISKSVAKKRLLSMLNGKSHQFKEEQEIFKGQYPSIYEFVFRFKAKNHRVFSHLVSQVESYIMLDLVARNLNNKHRRQVLLLTLHDSITTTEEYIALVKAFIEDTFLKYLNFMPVLKIKSFSV